MINNHIKVADITQYSILTVKQFEHLQTTALYHLLTLAFSLFYCVLVCISGIMPVMNHLSLKWSTLTSTILCPIISSIHTMLIYLIFINISGFKRYLFKTMRKISKISPLKCLHWLIRFQYMAKNIPSDFEWWKDVNISPS